MSDEFDTSAYPHVATDDVRILWADDWYDGPLGGMCEVGGERLRFACVDGGDGECWRRYALQRPTPEALAEAVRQRDLFRKHCGTDFDYSAPPDTVERQPDEERAKFFEMAKSWPEIEWHTMPVVGWFDL